MAETGQIDTDRFREAVHNYLDHVSSSDWYPKHEIFKFRFGRWINERINFELQTDEQILQLCKESQLQQYQNDTKEKGIHYITGQRRFKDEFIELDDVRALRRLTVEGGDAIKSLRETPPKLTFPKFAIWAASIFPQSYVSYGIDELTGPIATIFRLEKVNARGAEGFVDAQQYLRLLMSELRKSESQFTEVLAKHLGDSSLRDVDWSWLTADFVFYLAKKENRPAYYWVCQGANYAEERSGGFIWAPKDSAQHHHHRLSALKPGDRIVHYAKGAVRATSTASSKPIEAEYPVPGIGGGKIGLKVVVDYEDLEPFSSTEVFERLSGAHDALPKKYSPLAPGGTINQGYLFDFSEEAFRLLLDDCGYWVFQCNPKIYDIVKGLEDGTLTAWRVAAHQKKIKRGDKVILWATGEKSGVYALATVSSDVRPRQVVPANVGATMEVSLTVDRNLAKSPIPEATVRANPVTQNLKAGTEGTNFQATRPQYEAILEMTSKATIAAPRYWVYSPGRKAEHWNEFYSAGILGLGWEIGDYRNYQEKKDFASAIRGDKEEESSRKNSAAACFEFTYIMNPGDVVFAKEGRQKFIGYGVVTSDYRYDESRAEFRSVRDIRWERRGEWDAPEQPAALKTLTDITRDSAYVEYLKCLLGISEGRGMQKSELGALNQIFYGPPGTGKTYYLKSKLFPHFQEASAALSREAYLCELVKDLSWWQVIVAVLADLGRTKVRNIHDHELLRARASLSTSKSVTQTIWVQLQTHVVPDCPNVKYGIRAEPALFWKHDDSSWEVRRELAEDATPESYELLQKSKQQPVGQQTITDRFEFVTFHQSYSYEDFIEGIKPKTDPETGQISYELVDGTLKRLATKARNDPDHNYALFIDEINRGNVASIFGELITLIEEDKREGAPNMLSPELPYSKERFSLPSNLYIFGTMNTADRSVEALDTALRRRFTFSELSPDPEFFSRERMKAGKIDLPLLLRTINSRLERLADRDHSVGHAYFVSLRDASDPLRELKAIFRDKILPLLKEYFFGDYGKIGLVLGAGFVKEIKIDMPFADFDHYAKSEYEERKVFEVVDPGPLTEKDFIAIYS